MRYIIILTVCVLTCRCSPQSPSENNEATARKLFDAFNKHNWEEMASYYADSALFLDPSYGKEYVKKSRKETIEKYVGMQNVFPDIRDDVTGIYPSGNVVTVAFTSTGSMNDSVRFSLPIISVLTFKDGVIIKDATYYDQENP